MTPHRLTLTAGFAILIGVFLLPLVDHAYWSHVILVCLAALSVVLVGGAQRGNRWRAGDYS
jgi:peptidoglycan/LPS O-acetylase OafA/YrhL